MSVDGEFRRSVRDKATKLKSLKYFVLEMWLIGNALNV
jgi:hypothetical protein